MHREARTLRYSHPLTLTARGQRLLAVRAIARALRNCSCTGDVSGGKSGAPWQAPPSAPHPRGVSLARAAALTTLAREAFSKDPNPCHLFVNPSTHSCRQPPQGPTAALLPHASSMLHERDGGKAKGAFPTIREAHQPDNGHCLVDRCMQVDALRLNAPFLSREWGDASSFERTTLAFLGKCSVFPVTSCPGAVVMFWVGKARDRRKGPLRDVDDLAIV